MLFLIPQSQSGSWKPLVYLPWSIQECVPCPIPTLVSQQVINTYYLRGLHFPSAEANMHHCKVHVKCWGMGQSVEGVFCRWVFMHSPFGRAHRPLVGSTAGFWDPCGGSSHCPPLFSVPVAPTLFSCASHLSVLGGMRQKWASWSASHKAGKSGCSFHSHFSPWEKLQAERVPTGTMLCCLWGGTTWVKWKCFSYPLQHTYSGFFFLFCLNGMLESLHWTPSFPKEVFHPQMVVEIDVSVGDTKAVIPPILSSCWCCLHSVSSDLYRLSFQKIHWRHNETKGGWDFQIHWFLWGSWFLAKAVVKRLGPGGKKTT